MNRPSLAHLATVAVIATTALSSLPLQAQDEAAAKPEKLVALQDAWKAYRDSNGSMKAMLTSLLTSDAFLYRSVK